MTYNWKNYHIPPLRGKTGNKMTAKQAMEILEYWNRWRRHNGPDMLAQPDPTEVGLAIEAAIGALALLPEGWEIKLEAVKNEEI
jgi:hypothetical protein